MLSVVLLAVTAVICWRALTRDAFEEFRSAELSQGIDIYGNLRLFAEHPVKVLRDIVTRPYSSNLDHLIDRYDGARAGNLVGPALNFANYLRRLTNQFIGAFSWNFIGPPLRFAYLVMLLGIAFVELNPKPFTRADRTILLLVFAAALMEIYVLVIALDGTYRSGHFSFWSAGVTGRYIIPFCLAGLLALKRNSIAVSSRVLTPIVLSASTAYALLSLAVIVRFFYWSAGPSIHADAESLSRVAGRL